MGKNFEYWTSSLALDWHDYALNVIRREGWTPIGALAY